MPKWSHLPVPVQCRRAKPYMGDWGRELLRVEVDDNSLALHMVSNYRSIHQDQV